MLGRCSRRLTVQMFVQHSKCVCCDVVGALAKIRRLTFLSAPKLGAWQLQGSLRFALLSSWLHLNILHMRQVAVDDCKR